MGCDPFFKAVLKGIPIFFFKAFLSFLKAYLGVVILFQGPFNRDSYLFYVILASASLLDMPLGPLLSMPLWCYCK